MYSLELFVIAIYCLIEDALYPHFCHQHGQPRRAGFPPALSDSECLTLEVVGHYLGYGTQKQLYEQLCDRFGTWFPGLRIGWPLPGSRPTCGRSKPGSTSTL